MTRKPLIHRIGLIVLYPFLEMDLNLTVEQVDAIGGSLETEGFHMTFEEGSAGLISKETVAKAVVRAAGDLNAESVRNADCQFFLVGADTLPL